MPLSEYEKRSMRAATHEAAVNMVDDIDHMREIINKLQPTAGDLRRMSNLLRRLLIDNGGDIRKIAPPRLNRRLFIASPEIKRFIKTSKKKRLYFASLGASGIYGSLVGEMFIEFRYTLIHQPPWQTYRGPDPDDDEPLIDLTLDNFLKQPVLCYEKKWISRSEVIKYVANVASGVHTGDPKEQSHILLNRIRQIGSIVLENGAPLSRVNHHAITTGNKPINVDKGGIDFVLLQLMSAARYLTRSRDIIELEAFIRKETS
jgi:hypothetical protein